MDKEMVWDGKKVKVIGKSGDYYRIYLLTYGNWHHEWVPKEQLKELPKERV